MTYGVLFIKPQLGKVIVRRSISSLNIKITKLEDYAMRLFIYYHKLGFTGYALNGLYIIQF